MAVAMSGPRLLVKAGGPVPAARMAITGAEVPFQAEPLFESSGANDALGVAASRWYVLEAPPAAVEANVWGLCHALLTGGLDIAGAGQVERAEPDIQQRWITGREGEQALAMTVSCDRVDPQNGDFPMEPELFWFKDDAHSRLEAALAALGIDPATDCVRITRHGTLPKRIERELQRNLVDHERPDDATDGDQSGPLTNLEHGTGTLGILAGRGADGGLVVGGPTTTAGSSSGIITGRRPRSGPTRSVRCS